MKNKWKTLGDIVKILVGCTLFGIGFNMFLEPNHMNGGGLSGLAMIAVHWINNPAITIGLLTMLINIPLFIIGGWKIGKKFFIKSLFGMITLSVAIDATSRLPALQVDPLLAALYGGVLGGLGLGIVFSTGSTTGGSDIIVRFLKRKWKNVPIGTINTFFDMTVVALTGIAFQEVSSALYCGISVFIMGQVIDAVVYRFDYSRVALIVSRKHEEVARKIGDELGRGATFLDGEGAYSHTATKVVLTAVKRQQLAELKALVVAVDPDAFIIVQEAHQVLGDGFARYSKDSL
jgi:uncharacterized membrane-anchored protein YitT (DUF2179 family)